MKGSKLLVELSGEHPELPFYELQECMNLFFKVQDISYLDRAKRLIIIDLDQLNEKYLKEISNRISMTKTISVILFMGPIEELHDNLKKIDLSGLDPNSTFKLIFRQLNTNQRKNGIQNNIQQSELQNLIIRTISNKFKVDVKSPDLEFVLYFGQHIVLVRKLFEIDRGSFEHRKPQFRPYFAPISLHPRLARCMLNLAFVKRTNTILDPFCGTGGVLLEAGLIGVNIIGADKEREMVNGTKTNLENEGIEQYTLLVSDITDLPHKLILMAKSNKKPNHEPKSKQTIDAIVTEPPYGRATALFGESLESLIKRSFIAFSDLLKIHGRIVISLPDKEFSKLSGPEFKLLFSFKKRIHKSLTKHIVVFEKRDI